MRVAWLPRPLTQNSDQAARQITEYQHSLSTSLDRHAKPVQTGKNDILLGECQMKQKKDNDHACRNEKLLGQGREGTF
jgi:hypothetical protein